MPAIKLGRDVAIKMLPAHLAADPERPRGFEREARLLAALNHPHIGAIHGLEETEGVTALVLELVEGPTFADRLETGPLPMEEALASRARSPSTRRCARERDHPPRYQTGEHRDAAPPTRLRPLRCRAHEGSRLWVREDFGLERGRRPPPEGDRTIDATAEGRILGTPAYMSPEQATGNLSTTHRHLGVRMRACSRCWRAAARFPATRCPTPSVSILKRDPDWAELPPATPAAVRTLLDRCLQKDPANRLHDIADARIELDDGARPGASSEIHR